MYHKSEFGWKSGLKQHCLMRGVTFRKVRGKQRDMDVCVCTNAYMCKHTFVKYSIKVLMKR